MEPLRQIALCLHALAPGDRRWMLHRLPSEQRPTLHALLRELKVMGIPKDSTLLEIGKVETTAVLNVPSQVNKRRQIELAKATDIVTLLKGEPREVVAAVLRTGDWKWQQEVLNSYASTDKKWLNEDAVSKRKILPPAVRENLLTLVDQRLIRVHQESSKEGIEKSKSMPWWKRLSLGALWRR